MEVDNDTEYVLVTIRQYYNDRQGTRFVVPLLLIQGGTLKQFQIANNLGLTCCEDEIANMTPEDRESLFEITSYFFDEKFPELPTNKNHNGIWSYFEVDSFRKKKPYKPYFKIVLFYEWSYKY